jgi:exodeoxyribonuclease V gamma subunit
LPLGSVGDARHLEFSRRAKDFYERLLPYHPETTRERVPIELTIAGFRVSGIVPAPGASGRLLYRPTAIKGKDLVRAWITHLAGQLAGGAAAGRTVLVGEESKSPSIVAFADVPEAQAVFTTLLGLYREGLNKPLKFFPASALAFVEAAPDKSFTAARKKWTTTLRSPGEESDEYVARCFAGMDPLDEEFASTARAIFEPMRQALEVIE